MVECAREIRPEHGYVRLAPIQRNSFGERSRNVIDRSPRLVGKGAVENRFPSW
jgi:hypothetical protein